MSFYRSPFFLSRPQQLSLFIVILLILLVFFFRDQFQPEFKNELELEKIDAIQKKWDSMQQHSLRKKTKKWPINFNYLSDYQSYTLGIPPEAFDLFQHYRDAGGKVSSLNHFQQITKISDSMALILAPFFKAPNRQKQTTKRIVEAIQMDLNKANEEDFEKIYGIGPTLSKRIIKYRSYLGGFTLLDQCYEIYGLDSAVVSSIKKYFKIISPPVIDKININSATFYELQKTPYIDRTNAKKIIAFRTAEGNITTDDLKKVLNDSLHKIERIKLYLY